MAQQSLMDFLLGDAPPPLVMEPTRRVGQSSGGTEDYHAGDITSVADWPEFNRDNASARFGNVLNGAQLPAEPFSTSPPPTVNSEGQVRENFAIFFKGRLRHALRAGFGHMDATATRGPFRVMEFHSGGAAETLGGYLPYFGLLLKGGPTAKNYLPAEAKTSLTWRSAWGNDAMGHSLETLYREGLAEVNFYMKKARARYSFIITEAEFVAIQRLDNDGNLVVSRPIPWGARGDDGSGQMTVMMGLWYICMLASHETEWELDP